MTFRTEIQKQSRQDRQIGLAQYNELVDKVNALGNISIDGVSLARWSGSSKSFSLNKPKPHPHYPFEIEKKTSTSVTVRAGRWSRRVAATDKRLLLTVDGAGTSDDFGDVITITGLSASTEVYYIILTINSFVAPTTLVASAVTVYPSADVAKLIFVLGTVETNATGIISEINQWWTGGHIEDVITIPDGHPVAADFDQVASLDFVSTGAHIGELQLSNAWELLANASTILGYANELAMPVITCVPGGVYTMGYARIDSSSNTTHSDQKSIQSNSNMLQIYNMHAASNTIGAEFCMRSAAGGTVVWPTIATVAASFADYWYAGLCEWIVLNCDICGWLRDLDWCGVEGYVSHYNLADIQGGTYTKVDHGGHWVNNKATSGRYMTGTPDLTYLTNNGASIGDSTAVTSVRAIDLDNRQLTPNSAAAWTLDWSARQLDGDDWTVLLGTILKSADTTEITPYTIASGSVQFAGGLSAAKSIQALAFYVHSGQDMDKWTTTQLLVGGGTTYMNLEHDGPGERFSLVTGAGGIIMSTDAGGDIFLTAANDVQITGTGGAGLFNVAGNLSLICGDTLYLTPTGSLFINGVQGASVTNLFAKGICTNETGLSLVTITVPDGSGGTSDYVVLGKAA